MFRKDQFGTVARVNTRRDDSHAQQWPPRNFMMGKSKTRLNLYLLAFIAYWYAPVAYGMWLWHDLRMGAFSSNSDSIAIPIYLFVFLWFIGFPFFLLATIAFEMLLRSRDRRVRGRTLSAHERRRQHHAQPNLF